MFFWNRDILHRGQITAKLKQDGLVHAFMLIYKNGTEDFQTLLTLPPPHW